MADDLDLRTILALRLQALMDSRPDLDRQIKVAQASGVSQSTVHRVLKRQVHTSLDVIEALARIFSVRPQDLLAPLEGCESGLVTTDYAERALLAQWRQASAEDRHRVMAYLRVAQGVEPPAQPAMSAVDLPADKALQAAINRIAAKPNPASSGDDVGKPAARARQSRR